MLRCSPIANLVSSRLGDLGLTHRELVIRLGYRKINKGLRRLSKLQAGDLDGCADLLTRLPDALHVSRETVAEVIHQTRERQGPDRAKAEEERERAWRRSFVPHGIILTERSIPSQITICAFTKGDRLRFIELDHTRPRSTFPRQALSALNQRLEPIPLR
jgi:hypothetical protein